MNLFRHTAPYLKKYRKYFLWGFLFVTLSNFFGALIPRVIGNTIDVIVAGNFTSTQIATFVFELLFFVACSGFLMFSTRKTIIAASRKIEYDLRNALLEHIEKLPAGFFQRRSTGDLMAHLNNDVAAVREFIGPSIMYTSNTITTALFALIMMYHLNTELTLYTISPLPLISVATYLIGKRVHWNFRKVQEKFAQLTATAQETLSNIRGVRAYNREAYEASIFHTLAHSYYKDNMRLARTQNLMMPTMMLLVGFSQIIVLGLGGSKISAGEITYGELTQFFIYLNQLIWPVIAIGWVVNTIQRASASMERILDILSEPPEIPALSMPTQTLPAISGSIQFSHVYFQYPQSSSFVLQDISFEVHPGTILGIVGPIGSGKSTITYLLSRLYDSTSGTIAIDGKPITEYDHRVLRSFLGIVPQEPFLFSTSIAENIRFGNPHASFEEILTAAKMADIHKDIITFPNGYDTILGERGITLSGGQKQRLALARALIRNPYILILDDPLSAVDGETEATILQNIRSFMRERTTIIISHRISTIKDADWIIVLDKGQVVEEGTHQQLLQNGQLYAELYSLQMLEQEVTSLSVTQTEN